MSGVVPSHGHPELNSSDVVLLIVIGISMYLCERVGRRSMMLS